MMKYFLAITLIVAVASAAYKPNPEVAEIQEIIAAIQSPSTDPATAAALEEMLLDALGIKPEPVAVGPAIVNPLEGISVGPAIIPFPLPDGGAVVEEPIAPAPVVEAPAPVPSASSPLVQIIVNVNAQAAGSSPVAVSPVDIAAPEVKPEPIHVVEEAAEPEPSPIGNPIAVNPIVVDPAPEPSPIGDPIAVNPIGVGPIIEPVQIGVPILPEAAVVLPEQLN